ADGRLFLLENWAPPGGSVAPGSLEPPAQPEAHPRAARVHAFPEREAAGRVLHVAADLAGVVERLAEQPRSARKRQSHASPSLPAPAAERRAVVAAGLEVRSREKQHLVFARDPGVRGERAPGAEVQLHERHERQEIRRCAGQLARHGDGLAGLVRLSDDGALIVRLVIPVEADSELDARVDRGAAAKAEYEAVRADAVGIEESAVNLKRRRSPALVRVPVGLPVARLVVARRVVVRSRRSGRAGFLRDRSDGRGEEKHERGAGSTVKSHDFLLARARGAFAGRTLARGVPKARGFPRRDAWPRRSPARSAALGPLRNLARPPA